MKKYKDFFTTAKLLTSEQFDLLASFASFELIMPSKNNPILLIAIKCNNILPIELYECIKSNATKINNFRVQFVFLPKLFDSNLIHDYIIFFIKKNYDDKPLLKEIFIKSNIVVDDQIIKIKCFGTTETQEATGCFSSLKNFLNEAGFCFINIETILDLVKQNKILRMEEEKQRIIDEKIKNMVPIKIETISSKKEKENKISGRFSDLSSITSENFGLVNICGEIFSVNKNKGKNDTLIYKFKIFDHNEGALPINYCIFLNSSYKTNLTEQYLESFKVGDWIEANVELSSNVFSKFEPFGKIKKICHGKKPKNLTVIDDADEKRIELLSHSKMSSFDGIVSANDIINFAQNLGHDAIAIIDRGNVQAFPEIMNNKNKIKKIYGCEFEVLQNDIVIATNPKNILIENATYAIFDIETTGLNANHDEIIEFGGIKIKDNKVIDRIQFFIKPKASIPAHITKITKIDDELVKNGITIKSGLEKIVSWVKDCILVAHNGINFDMRFINRHLEKNNMSPLENCLIDTMILSRAINTRISTHNLGKLCRRYMIQYNEEVAHRADNDAEFLMNVWQAMIEQLKQMNIININQINNVVNENLLSYQHGFFVDVYVKNQAGIKDLYKLVSLSLTKQLFKNNNDSGRPKLFFKDLMSFKTNLLICPHPTEGQIWDSALNDCDREFEQKVNQYDYIFVSPPKNLKHLMFYQTISNEEINLTIKKIINISQKLNKKIIAVSDCYYLLQNENKIHEIYLYAKQLGGKRHRNFYYGQSQQINPKLYFLTTKEMIDAFNFLKNEKLVKDIVINNSKEFTSIISDDIKPLKTKLCPPSMPMTKEKLTDLVYKNAQYIYGENIDKKILDRIKKELSAINSNNYDIIYWISHLLVEKSLSDGYLVGSRGSVGSSLVAFFTHISEVNPLPPHYICKKCHHYIEADSKLFGDGFDLPKKNCPICNEEMYGDGHNIPFETFLGFRGEKIPDIDLNFSGEYQSKAHSFIKEIFGEDKTFRAGTISTIAQKTAFGFVKNYFEESNSSKQISSAYIDYLALRCTDVKKTTGQHPGGIIIVPKEYEITDFSPYNYPADDKKVEWFTSHFAFENIHDTLLKFDILGHDDPTSLKYLHELTKIDPKKISFHDENVIGIFTSSKTLNIIDPEYDQESVGSYAVPEFGTKFVRTLLSVAKPKTFEDLVRISGLSHGTDVWTNNAVNLISKANMSLQQVIACRDDIMIYLINMGVDSKTAFSVMESVRKGRGINPDDEKVLTDSKIPEWYISSCKKIKYLFPKAHAAAYVLMAWRIAWYKVYYPLEFYATYFSIRTEAFDLETIIKGKKAIEIRMNEILTKMNGPDANLVKNKELNLLDVYAVALEMIARGFTFANINLNESLATKFIIRDKMLVFPFVALDSLGIEVASSIVNERQIKPFTSRKDLLNRTKISTTIFKKMCELGILDRLSEDDQMDLFSLI